MNLTTNPPTKTETNSKTLGDLFLKQEGLLLKAGKNGTESKVIRKYGRLMTVSWKFGSSYWMLLCHSCHLDGITIS
jgi:hypothetical protein